MWSDPSQYPFEAGKLFLGHVRGKEIGIKTERHAITIAGAGSGKGTSVIIPNLLRWTHNALVIDPKGENAEATAEAREAMGQAVHVLAPFGAKKVPERFHATYNPLDELDPEALTIKEDIDAISDGTVMRADPEAANWDDGAQTVISGLIAHVLITAEPDKKNLIEVRNILRNDDRLAEAAEAMRDMEECAGVAQEAASTIMAKEGNYYISNARKNTKWLDSKAMVEALSTSSFSVADLKNKNTTVFLVLPANYLGQHGRFLRLFVRAGIEAMAKETETGELRDKQCLFMLDEFFSLGRIDEIAKASGLMRGYGLQLWPILQDLGQLIDMYGREGSETFFANADLHQFFGNTDPLTLEQISARLGVTDMKEIPLPPAAPAGGNLGIGQMIGGGGARDKRDYIGQQRGILGGAISMLEQGGAAAAQAKYQDDMNSYQREIAQHGNARLSPDEVSALIHKKDDVVADNMICFLFGREPLLVQPAPYFRKIEDLDKKESLEKAEVRRIQVSVIKRKTLFIAGVFLGLMAIAGLITGLPAAETGGQLTRVVLLIVAVAAASVFLIRKSFKPEKG
jgi:hypothetical protein